ncbi:hypothetical protein [Fulvivirga lutimaris]|uniref:hypothetical protein n=1 Tax=Fulvivirga lutimaris TaxID=1819566 RepID=UPI0012BBB32E|nr:hypothetical protein [Fulvivirga lutimaris]MTI38254.1 hypothetical protein [Fulvivirga lutimaris]
MKSILILCYGPLHRDPRVLRQIKWLKEDYTIYTAGYTNSEIDGINYIPLSKCYPGLFSKIVRALLLFLGLYKIAYWNTIRKIQLTTLNNKKYDLIVANDIDALPICDKISSNQKIPFIFDAHEYYPDFAQKKTLTTWLQKREVIYQCNRYLKRASAVTTVASGIAQLYEQNFSVPAILIRNSSPYTDIKGSIVDPENIQLVHHGGTMPGRQLEKMIDIVAILGKRYSLHFYLVAPQELKWYEKKIINYAKSTKANVYFHRPVKTNQIIKEINKYDIGLFLLPPTNTNYKLALPNKFFEFVQAKLALAIGPSEEMANIVTQYDLGVVSNTFTAKSLAEELEKLSLHDIVKYKNNCIESSKELSAGKDEVKFLEVIKKSLA